MPSLIVFLLRNFAIGAVAGILAAIWLAVGDAEGMSFLLQNSDQRLLATALLAFSLGSTFGLGAIATGMFLDDGND